MAVLSTVEPKVKAGAAVGAATGAVVWALVSYVPAFHAGVPEPVVAVLPFALAWAGHTIAGYMAPHDTSRDPKTVGDVTGVTGTPPG